MTSASAASSCGTMTISACFGVDAADGVNGELLDDAVDRGDQAGLALALAGFDDFLWAQGVRS